MATVMQRIFCCFRPAASQNLRESSTSHSGAQVHPFHQTSDTTTTPAPPKKLAKINSMYSSDDLIVSEFKSNNFKELRYNCPICFCYFNKTSCCANYICHGCSDALNHRVLVNTRINVVACPFCSNEEFVISDVDPKQQVKQYTDTPMRSTPRENVFSQFKDLIESKFSRFSGNKPTTETKEEKESQIIEIGFSSDGFNNLKNIKEKPSRPLTSENPIKTSAILHQFTPKKKTPKIHPIERANQSTVSVEPQTSHRQI